VAEVEFFAEPGGEGIEEHTAAAWGDGEERFEEAGEFDDGFVVEDDGVELVGGEVGVEETGVDGVDGEAGIVFDAGEPFFLGGGGDDAVREEDGGGVVVEGGDAEDMAHGLSRSEEGIHEWGEYGAGAKDDEGGEEQEDDGEGDKPPFLFLFEELEELDEQAPHVMRIVGAGNGVGQAEMQLERPCEDEGEQGSMTGMVMPLVARKVAMKVTARRVPREIGRRPRVPSFVGGKENNEGKRRVRSKCWGRKVGTSRGRESGWQVWNGR
jgi:hypothetical protein